MKRIATCPYCHSKTSFTKLGSVFSGGVLRKRYQCHKCGKLCYVPATKNNSSPIGMKAVLEKAG